MELLALIGLVSLAYFPFSLRRNRKLKRQLADALYNLELERDACSMLEDELRPLKQCLRCKHRVLDQPTGKCIRRKVWR